jgi:AraC family transcriptional regulator
MSLHHFSPKIEPRQTTLDWHMPAINHVVQILREQCTAESLSLQHMADIAALSPYYFDRIFRAIIGIPPGEFQAALRLEAAKRLLLTTPLSVTEVCFEVGYHSLGTFTSRFTQLVGLSPQRFRQLPDAVASTIDPLRELTIASPLVRLSSGAGPTGTIIGPDDFSGLIFVGIFPKPIPQKRPVAGTILTTLGPYHLDPLPDGHYYVLVAALPWSQNPLDYLLPSKGLLVGRGREPLLVHHGQVTGDGDVVLRPMIATDPPLLVALFALLTDQLACGVLNKTQGAQDRRSLSA